MSTDGQLRFSLAERKAGSMSTPSNGNSVSVSNLEDFNDAVKSVHKTDSTTNWLLVGYDGSPDKIKLLSTGTKGINELIEHFEDSSMVYAILRVVDHVDNIPTDRFVYITFIGDNVKAIEKAKYSVNKTSVTKLLGHYNVEIIASVKSELSETEIMNKIQDASGSRNRSGEVTQKTPQSSSTTTPSSSSSSSSVIKTTGTTSGSKGPAVNTKSVGLTFNNESELKQIVEQVKTSSDPVNWMLIGYEDKERLGLFGKGTGGLQELVSHLKDQNVNYGIVATTDVIDGIVQPKHAQITFVGVSVSPMVKGRLTTHRGKIDEFFSPIHVSLFSENPSQDLTDEILAQKVQQLKGMK
ncbi:hypothetical protein ACTA71_012569 [Dictyostelium dimigraforme]